MMNLWILLLLMLLLALGVVWLSLRLTKTEPAPTRDALNKQLYKQRLNELDLDEAQGLLTQEPELVNELKLGLLDELPQDNNEPSVVRSVSSKGRGLFPSVLIVTLTALLYFSLGGYDKVARWQEVMTRMPELTDLMLVRHGKGATNQDLEDFILGVRSRLMQDPSDIRGWDLLGRIGMGTNNLQLAIDSYQQALVVAPDDKDLKMSYAKVLSQTGDPSYIAQAEKISASLLSEQPDHLEALSIEAFAALQQENFAKAIEVWKKMERQLPDGSERKLMIERSIAYAQKQLEQSSASNMTTQAEPTALQSYQVTLDLGANVTPEPGATLFVFATAVEGSPLPLAVKRMPLPEFPVTLSLSDLDSMTAEHKLSNSPLFYFGARIDSDGNIETKVGWKGQSAPVAKGSTVISEIMIDEAMSQ